MTHPEDEQSLFRTFNPVAFLMSVLETMSQSAFYENGFNPAAILSLVKIFATNDSLYYNSYLCLTIFI